ncbi:hypothetical protein [Campylobacter sp. RM16190]|uniref:hypothetical protein n=1 Tax=Campylobacter sp. RM16190 TaxID=1705727 RepID=UPI001476739E|nr:hypothetical protein [Campylobacter sp. RM16190]
MRKFLGSALCAISLMAMPQDAEHTPEQIAKNIEIEISAHLPKKIDEHITFKNIKAFGSKITYSYEIHDTSSVKFSQFSWQKIDDMKKTYHEKVLKSACTKEDTRAILNTGVFMEYRYTLDNGKFFFQFSLSKDECEKSGL